MVQRIAINGFGRIGRATLRALLECGDEAARSIEIVAINDLAPLPTLAHLLSFDSAYGRLNREVEVGESSLTIDGRKIDVFSEPDPKDLPWASLDIDVVIEATGRFTAAEDATAHIEAGAQRVLVTAPSKGADLTLVMGVNDHKFDSEQHRIISNGSCTTNALAPISQVLNDLATIEHGFVTTVHAYTQDQKLVDGEHRDLRRARAAAVNIVPTTTGAARTIGLVIPELHGKLTGDALRVPIPVGSIVELNSTVRDEVTLEQLLEAYEDAAENSMKGVLTVSHDPLVSSDIVGNPYSAIVDAGLIRVDGNHVKVSAWYDNEWAFSSRLLDAVGVLDVVI